MNDWIDTLLTLADDGVPSVLVTVAQVRGSAPREVGAKMIVTATESIGSIGGGQLEYQCTRIACEALRDGNDAETSLRKFALGAGCGQCCGGVVKVLFESVPSAGWLQQLRDLYATGEPFVMGTSVTEARSKYFMSGSMPVEWFRHHAWPAASAALARKLLDDESPAVLASGMLLEPVRSSGFHIAVFGAGHVGAATVDALSRLDCNIRWIDSRRDLLPRKLPGNVQVTESCDPGAAVAAMPPGSYYLVMTHSHPLDLQICERILTRGDHAYVGLIGSVAKRRKFERLLKQNGQSARSLAALHCPIGLPGLQGKKPAVIALSVAADLLQRRQAAVAMRITADEPQAYTVPG